MDTVETTVLPIRKFMAFTKFIAKHDLWDVVEQHLNDRGCTEIRLSAEPIKEVGLMLLQKASTLEPGVERDPDLICSFCMRPPNVPHNPPPGGGGPPDGGDGGGPPDGGDGGVPPQTPQTASKE